MTTFTHINSQGEANMVDVSAKVEIVYSGHPLIKEESYHLLESHGIAVDHGCIVTNALLYLKNQLEGK